MKKMIFLSLVLFLYGNLQAQDWVKLFDVSPSSEYVDSGSASFVSNAVMDVVYIAMVNDVGGVDTISYAGGNDTVYVSDLAPGVYDIFNAALINGDTVICYEHFVIETVYPSVKNLLHSMETCGNNGWIKGGAGNAYEIKLFDHYDVLLATTTVDCSTETWMFDSLAAGGYYVRAYDSYGYSTRSRSIVIANQSFRPIQQKTAESSFCGNAVGSWSGAFDKYSLVSIIGPGVHNINNNDFELWELPVGNNKFSFLFENNCVVYDSVMIVAKDSLSAHYDATGVTYHLVNDGSLEITDIDGGQSPYSCLFHGLTIEEKIDLLPAGIDSILIEDADGCQITLSFEILDSKQNMFSNVPNGMWTTDCWAPVFPDNEHIFTKYPNARVQIINSASQIVFDTETNALPWCFSDYPKLAPDVYFYLIYLDKSNKRPDHSDPINVIKNKN